MISVLKINEEWFSKTIEFLKSVPSIESIDEKILNNACIALDDEKIVGCISYEEFSSKGLIRYFVFKKALNLDYLDKLVDRLKENAIKNNINEFVCVAESEQIKELFKSLDFEDLDEASIFIDEESISNTNFRNSIFLKKQLEIKKEL